MEAIDSRVVVFSADGHAGPGMAAFTEHLDPGLRPAYEDYLRGVDDYDTQVADIFAGRRSIAFEDMQKDFIVRDAITGLADPTVHLRELEADGVVGDVIFPQGSVPFAPYPPQPGMLPALDHRATGEQLAGGCRAYNRWLAEFCGSNPGRHAGIGVMPIRDVAAAVEEVAWSAEAGIRSMSLPPISESYPYFNDPGYESIWAACADHGLPLSTHGASTRFYGYGPDSMPIALAEVDFFGRRPLWFLIFSGVFERHPSLRLVVTEQRAGWVLPTLAYLDDIYESSVSGLSKVIPRSPSSYFASNCYIGASFMSHAEAEQRDRIGTDRLMWGQDYPHPEGAWPWSRESLRQTFEGVPEDELRQMVGGNAIECYGMDREVLERAAATVGPTIADLQVPYRGKPEGSELSWAFRTSDAWT